jgi:DNA polymerase-1
MEKQLLVLLDGNAIIHRAFHAFRASRPPVVFTVRSTGEIVTAVYGFAQMLLKTITDLQPSCYAVAFDTPEPTFRHVMFEAYKAQRPPTPDELIDQFARVRELVEAFNIPIYELPGYEADDVLGTLSRQAAEQGMETYIVTGDADTMQLVSPMVKVISPRPRGSFSDTIQYDEAAVFEKFGVTPRQIIDLKALKGDPSDNIPGVPGIGEKTAVKLISQFGSLEGIYDHLDEVEPARIQAILRDNREIGFTSKTLATINVQSPVTLDLDRCRLSRFDRNKVASLFRELEFNSLIPKLPGSGEDVHEEESDEASDIAVEKIYSTVIDEEALEGVVEAISTAEAFAFDLETTGLDAVSTDIVGISLATKPGEAWYIPVGHIGFFQGEQLPLTFVLEKLKPVFEDEHREKIAHNAKFDMLVLAQHGIDVRHVTFDTMIAAHLAGEQALGLKNLTFSRLGIEMTPITELIGSGAKQVPMSQVDIAAASDYACADADMTFRLSEVFRPELKKYEVTDLFRDVEMPLVPVLVDMERNGVKLNTALMGDMARELGDQIRDIENRVYEAVGRQFNINSPKQLGQVLFEELGLASGGKTKSGYSTAAGVLEDLRGKHPVIDLVLEYRQLTKMKSTYVDALPMLVNRKTGRVHTSFNQTRTSTGRLSSSDPNLQNIPVRSELGMRLREAFIASDGWSLISGDYSQIDLRALAHLSKDENLVAAFKNDKDIHSDTASKLFGVDIGSVTSDQRRFAKTINFGVIYGMSEYGLEQATEMTRAEAGAFIKTYFEQYPGVSAYLEATRQQARDIGYVQTLLGRRRYIPEINSSNRQVKESAERMAINMPVQGTSADIIKVAMINLRREMLARKTRSRMLVQVHDELLFEVPDEEMEEMVRLVREIMTTAIELLVPLKVDINTGKNWAELKKH